MKTLVINAPSNKVGKKSFGYVMQNRVGVGYIITPAQLAQLYQDCGAVVLDKTKKQRAEGILYNWKPTKKAGNGQQRYNIYIKQLKPVAYKPERLNRNGVAVI